MPDRLLGIDIGGTNIRMGLVDADGRIIAQKKIPTLMEEGPLSLVKRISEKALRMAGEGASITQAGVGIAGLIDHRKGIVRFSPNLLGWDNIPLKKMLCDSLGVPVAVGNDVNVIAWGEYRFGGYNARDLFCFTLGTGVGGGIVSDGRLILGANDAAAEFGHTSFEKSSRCACGLSGCLEAYVGSSRLVAQARHRMKKGSPLFRISLKAELTPKLIAAAAKAGDSVALAVFREAGERLGRALGNVVQLLDPEVIVVNGGISNAGKILLGPIRESLKSYTMPLRGRRLRVVRSRLGDRAGILGAAALAEIL